MDPIEEVNYMSHYRYLFETPENLDANRKCLAQTYSASLKLLDSQDALNLLEINLDKYVKLMDDDNNYIKSSNSVKQTGLDNIDLATIIKPQSCAKNGSICCENIENNITNENLQEFMKLFNEAATNKQDFNVAPKTRKFAKSFAPRCCVSRDKKINLTSVAEKPILTLVDQNKYQLHSVPEFEERKSNNSCFKTARDELHLQNMKKFGSRAEQQSSQSNQVTTGGQKRKLGIRRSVQNKFVSPVLSNNSSSEELLPKSQEWPADEVVDERLKNIEPRMVELIRSEIMDVGTVVDWDDIAGLEFAKAAIQEAVVWPLLRPDIFTGLRKPPKGILLFGPPGTGKTLIGKCVASQSKSTFFSISASSLTSKWIGDGEKMVRALFAVARCHQPAVIFIDEIDSLLSQRSETEHESSRRIKTEFLVQLDGATTDNEERILVIGATNRPQELDEAARRRFVKRLYIPLPELQARLQLVNKLMTQEPHDLSTENMQEISQMSNGYSGADIKNLCSEASLGPIRCIDFSKMQSIQATEVRPVGMTDFVNAFSRVRSSVSPNDLEHYLTWNKTYGSGAF